MCVLGDPGPSPIGDHFCTPCEPHSELALLNTTFYIDLGNDMGKKVILVTGANKGIGLAIVETLLQQLPEAVVLLGSRDASRG